VTLGPGGRRLRYPVLSRWKESLSFRLLGVLLVVAASVVLMALGLRSVRADGSPCPSSAGWTPLTTPPLLVGRKRLRFDRRIWCRFANRLPRWPALRGIAEPGLRIDVECCAVALAGSSLRRDRTCNRCGSRGTLVRGAIWGAACYDQRRWFNMADVRKRVLSRRRCAW
jgi:hypothetical protein